VRIVACLVLLAVSAPSFSQSLVPIAGRLHFAFQKIGGPQMRFVDCKQEAGACRHDLDRGAYVLARGNGEHAPVEEIAAYFGADKPGAAQATIFVMSSMKLLSPSASERSRGDALKKIVNDAATSRRGEVIVAGIKYVLRASDGNDIRVYITLP
jgi:hypothetical protein